jgi:hypothetical protein
MKSSSIKVAAAPLGAAAVCTVGPALTLPVNVGTHSKAFDGGSIEAIVLSRRQIRILWDEKRVIAEVRL